MASAAPSSSDAPIDCACPAADAAATRTIDPALAARIRREFFARAKLSAARYGVSAEDVIAHLETANLAETPGPARALSYMDDLTMAVACVRGHPQAWADAWERHESILIRASRMRLEESDGIVFTRRFWIDLHALTVGAAIRPPPSGSVRSRRPAPSILEVPGLRSLREFVGVRPLRIWLTDRLLGRLESEARRALESDLAWRLVRFADGRTTRSAVQAIDHAAAARFGRRVRPGEPRPLRLVD